ncbi:hypothetical protein ACRYCC_22260 [Actinomadura scrupuli]|uniref:hypothetical protein n=1 Tax=Actinomadura scrupuli TaxID=559629 RepID=UPI003D96A678
MRQIFFFGFFIIAFAVAAALGIPAWLSAIGVFGVFGVLVIVGAWLGGEEVPVTGDDLDEDSCSGGCGSCGE